MVLGSALNTGLQGVQSGLMQFNQNAQKMASMNSHTSGTDLANMAEVSVGMLQAELQVQASAKVVSVEKDLLGSLIDIKA